MNKMVVPQIIKVDKATDYVGLKIRDGQVKVYVPAFFRIEKDKEQLQKDLLYFVKSISIAKTLECEKVKSSNDKNLEEVCPVESYLWLIQDFLQNGVFYNREKQYVKDGKGRIDWKRTLRNVPIMSDGNIIYDKVVCSRMAPTNDLISQIYKICVFQSQCYVGWLFGYKLHLDVQQVCSVKEMIYEVTRQIKLTYDDLKKTRFIHMLNVLKGIAGENALSSYCVYGVENYYYAYEVMIDKVFKGVPAWERANYNPVGYWKILNNAPVQSSNLRPDTIHIRDKELFIIDAKMYQYGATTNITDLPTTTSMQKQITYGDYVKSISKGKYNIRNAFVLPYDKTLREFVENENMIKFNDSNLAYLGEAYVSWRDRKNEDYDYIYTFLIDFNHLLNSYASADDNDIDVLCYEINKRIGLKNNE